MYGLNRLHSANRKQLLRAFSVGTDDLLYVGKGHKICSKDEIEGQIRNRQTIYQNKKRKKLHVDGRKVLPPKLRSRNVARLTCKSTAAGGFCDVHLVGSDHGCKESWREIENVISYLQPQVVFLELCSRRLEVFTGHEKVPTIAEMFDMWKKNEDPFWILTKWFYAKCSNRCKCSEHIWLGGEFRAAYKEAMKYGGKVILGDRPIHITLRRQLALMSPWVYFFDPLSIMIAEDLPKTKPVNTDPYLMTELISKRHPTYAKVHIMERDQYMSAKLLEVAREHKSVVAVVGKGHLPGIQKNWQQPVDLKEIHSIPAGNRIGTMGKLLSTFGATTAALSLSPSLRRIVTEKIAAYYKLKK